MAARVGVMRLSRAKFDKSRVFNFRLVPTGQDMSTFENRLPAGGPIFLTPDEKALIRRYAFLCQLWREGDGGFAALEHDLAAGCSILAERIAISTTSRHIIGADAGDPAFHAAGDLLQGPCGHT
jgi:hypothetical protein